jgi:HipA-like protein
MRKWLSEALQAWGMTMRNARAEKSTRALRLFVPVGGDRVLVGTLWREGGEYLFSYSDEFKRSELPPVFEFPEKDRVYRSPTLWPFFEVRMPPTERPDVEALVRERRLDTRDEFRMLAELGKRTITNPYEFELYEPSRA